MLEICFFKNNLLFSKKQIKNYNYEQDITPSICVDFFNRWI